MSQQQIDKSIGQEYAAGFVTDVESETLAPGLDEDVIRFISAKKDEPEWLLEWRLEVCRLDLPSRVFLVRKINDRYGHGPP